MGDLTPAMVELRLEAAAEVFTALPEVRQRGFYSAWPDYQHSFGDKVGQEPKPMKLRPSPRAITEAEETLLWLRWLDQPDARLLWLRANRTPWKRVCWELGMSRAHAHRRWRYGVAVIVWRLNGRTPPTRRSIAYVIERAFA